MKVKIVKGIRLIARVLGSLSVMFLLFMIIGNLIPLLNGPEETFGGGFKSTREFVSFLFFPVSILIGLSLAWKWDGLGGIITIGGMIAFFILRPDLISNLFMISLPAPGLLFLIYWILSRGQKKQL